MAAKTPSTAWSERVPRSPSSGIGGIVISSRSNE